MFSQSPRKLSLNPSAESTAAVSAFTLQCRPVPLQQFTTSLSDRSFLLTVQSTAHPTSAVVQQYSTSASLQMFDFMTQSTWSLVALHPIPSCKQQYLRCSSDHNPCLARLMRHSNEQPIFLFAQHHSRCSDTNSFTSVVAHENRSLGGHLTPSFLQHQSFWSAPQGAIVSLFHLQSKPFSELHPLFDCLQQ